MSNFQRSRSKVWWGDSPPNIGSPVAVPPERNPNHQANGPHEDNWAPQLPHWIANEQVPPAVIVNNQDNSMSPEVAPNQWPLRHGSPGSHKSQDSGFSDSDSSPPSSQYCPSPASGEGKSPSNKSSSSSDSNNNENVTVKQAISFKESPKSAKSLDTLDAPSTSKQKNNEFALPNCRLRSTSVIQTPYDLQKYMEVHDDEEHMKLLTDSNDDSTDNIPVKESPTSDIKITLTPPQNEHNNSNAADKSIDKKSFVSKKKESTSKGIKVAKVKDLETNKTKSQDSLQFLQVSDIDHIAVNNQPRIRSPISAIPYEPAPDYNENKPERKRPVYSRSHSQQNRTELEESQFQRNRLNKSLNYEAQRLDQQILDIQEGYHSLGYIHEDISHLKKHVTPEVTPTSRGFTTRNITDSLHLKTHKKVGPKSKQRHASKAKAGTCSFRIFPTKRDKPGVVETHAGGVLEGSRVPSLGLPRCSEQDQWVMVGYPEQEMLVHNERLIGSASDVKLHETLNQAKESQSKAAEVRRLTPPLQFQDQNKERSHTNRKSIGDLTHDSKREKLKGSTENFNGHLNMACTSTPKMLKPNEYMDQMFATPQIPTKSNRLRRKNLLENFNGNTNSQEPSQFRERSIDETPLERAGERAPGSVRCWLAELAGSCEPECATALQSKPLGGEHRAAVSAGCATITGNIRKVQTHGQIIVHQYGDVLMQLESGSADEEQLCLLVANVNEFVLAHSITLNTRPPGETPERWDRIKKSLQAYLQRLVDIGEDIKTELNDSGADWAVVGRHLDSLVKIFEETTKAVLVQQLRTLVSIIEEPPSDLILKSTLTSIAHLAAPGDAAGDAPHASCARLLSTMRELPFVECAVPRALLAAAIETDKSSVKALALRALATICVTGEAVQQFEEGGGIEIISDMLSDAAVPEPAAREAVTVLAQVTAPWLRARNPRDLRPLRAHLDPLVASITRIVTRTECCQLLLLCAACLANLVRELAAPAAAAAGVGGAEGEADGVGEALARHRSVERLLDAVKARGPGISVFLQEQTASLLSEVSRARGCAGVLGGARAASVALVCFARAAPAHARDESAPEQRARARLLRHTAAAIARLCVLPEVASQIVQLEGVPRLIRLVRMQRTRQLRPDSDETLLHCLQALRTIHRHQPDAFRGQQADVDDMIRPHLAESLMKFSSKKESFV